jgi:flagellar biosynthetic protein FlhB
VSGFGAPIVLAKGADLMAARIREKAKEYDIEMVENRALARTLYYTVDIGDEIPPELYQVVAEILAMVYTLRDKAKEGTRV